MGNEGHIDKNAQSMLLGHVAEEAHAHRHFCMSCRRRGAFTAPRSLSLLVQLVDAWYLGMKWKTGRTEEGERWQQCRDYIRFAASIIEGFDGASGC